jgi:Zn-dependent metalloprotease
MSSLAKAVSAALLLGVAGQAAADNSAVITRALGAINQNPVATRLSASDAFVARSITVDRNGTEHVHFERTYHGLPVIGGDLVVHSLNGTFRGTNVTIASPINIGTTPKLTAATAITNAGVKFGTGFDSTPTAKLVVYARSATPVLAYDVLYTGAKKDRTPTRMHYVVDATSGAILASWDAIETGVLPGGNYGTGLPPATPNVTPATGLGHSLYVGDVVLSTQLNNYSHMYELKDPTRGNTYITDIANQSKGNGTLVVDGDNKWGNGTTSDRVSTAVDAAYGFAKTWDFYKNVFGRLGIAGDGVGAFGAVHFLTNYSNAFWSNDCFCMAFGDGDGVHTRPLVALDIMGHEMSHGVTYATAGLAYVAESGGLNEANSDIMGTMVEWYANNANDTPDYLIGEEIYTSDPSNPPALRTMFKPSLDGISDDCFPDGSDPKYLDFFTWKGIYTTGGKDMHYTSGVANHFFYLLAEGAVVPAGWGVNTKWNLTPANLVCNGNSTLQGIGRAAAEQIWFRALTTYFTTNETYHTARAATLSAATDLYGAGSPQYNAVIAAWDAVNVH